MSIHEPAAPRPRGSAAHDSLLRRGRRASWLLAGAVAAALAYAALRPPAPAGGPAATPAREAPRW